MTAAFLRRWGVKLSTLVIKGGHATTAKAILPLLTPELDELALLNVSKVAIVFDWMAETGTQELRFDSLNVKWTYSCVGGGLEALHDMKYSSMQALCRDRGIRFGIVDKASIDT
jgi:hypothetical protein